MSSENPLHQEMAAAWDVVARAKYRAEFDENVRLLRDGGHNLLEPELAVLAPLLPGASVIQLQCSHGLDALGLLNLGAKHVVGIDLSREMIDQAAEKAERAGLETAEFICADAIKPPSSLNGTADLVYTGRGSLPWLLDLAPWAHGVARLLKDGGSVFIFEGHPLASLWDRKESQLRLRPGISYFDPAAAEAPGFPASVVERELGNARPRMLERIWRPGEVIGALLEAGLELRMFREYPLLFWDQFPDWADDVRSRLPNSYALLARRMDSAATGPGAVL